MLPSANWYYPTAIRFGAGRIDELAEACVAAGITRPLFVTDPGLANLPITTRALGVLAAGGLPAGVFTDVQPNPTEANVAAGLRVAARRRPRRRRSPSAAARRSTAARSSPSCRGQSRAMWEFEDIGDWWTRADPAGIAPVVAVPTTAGTGSEMGRAGVITNLATRTKNVIFHPRMMPRQVILDPELTVGPARR